MVVFACLIPKFLTIAANSPLINCLPLSNTMVSGVPNLWKTSDIMNFTTCPEIALGMTCNKTNLDQCSRTINICVFPAFDLGIL